MEVEECRRQAVGMLLSYQDNKARIKVLEADLRSLDKMTGANMAVAYDQPSSGKTYKITSVVESEAISLEGKREAIQNEIARLENAVERVDIALANMPYVLSELLKLKYIQRLYWKEVAEQISYDEYYVKKELKGRAIDVLACYLYPELSAVNLFEAW